MLRSNLLLITATIFLSAAQSVAADRDVVVPKDNVPFKVNEKDIVRLVGEGIAGSKITAKIEGPAKEDMVNHVSARKNGQVVVGTDIVEFELKATGKGRVKVKITVVPPTGGQTEAAYEYEIE